MSVASFTPPIGFYLDALSLVMMLVITGVGFLIHLYSAEYMIDERDTPVFRLHESVRGRDADAGAGGQSSSALSRLGRGGTLQLPFDRILVSRTSKRARRAEGLHRHSHGRHALAIGLFLLYR